MGKPAPAATAQVRELFDAKAATWSSKYEPGGRLTGRLAQLAAAVQQQALPGSRVLDFGCATGDLARHLATAGLHVTGCDISAEMLHRAAQADPAGSVAWTGLDPGWRRLPFSDGTFDAIVASSVLEYVDEPGAVLRECARVLRPGGTLLCTVPDLRHPVRWVEWLAALLARPPLITVLARRSPPLTRYLAYLRISQQRRPARSWHAVANRNGLHPVARPADRGGPQPLRLLALRRSVKTKE